MQARMNNPVMILPDALKALLAVSTCVENGSIPSKTIGLVQLRASQINGCSVCVDMHTRYMKEAGETPERCVTVSAWRDTPYFSEAERAALALTEAVTRLNDRPDPVPDDIWNEAVKHYDERGLASLLVAIAAALPLILEPLVDPTQAAGRALWQWSAVGGPTIQASYHLDMLSAIALALTIAFAGAAIASAARIEPRHPALAALILAIGLITMALVVTDDLVAAIVVLPVLAATTVLALFIVAPASATARAAAYLSIGLQAWVLSALLVSRSGSPTFLLAIVPDASVTPGAILAATLGALLFAGLYPVVFWSLEEGTRDPGPLGQLFLRQPCS